MKSKNKSYIYSDKKHTVKGIIATILSLISLIALIIILIMSYSKEGKVSNSYGVTVLLCLIYSITGIIFGVLGRYEEDKYYLFANIGIAIGGLDVLLVSLILYVGAFFV